MTVLTKAEEVLTAQRQHQEDEYFKAEALASWSSYKETGMHLTGDEVIAWLNTWGRDKEAPISLHK